MKIFFFFSQAKNEMYNLMSELQLQLMSSHNYAKIIT